MVHILLNGGFQDDQDKFAIINYLTNLGGIDSSIIPLLLGVDNGRDFYFSSLINSVSSSSSNLGNFSKPLGGALR